MMGAEEELYQLFAQPGMDQAARQAAYQSWVNTRGTNQALDAFFSWHRRQILERQARELSEYAEIQHSVFSEALERIIEDLKGDAIDRLDYVDEQIVDANLTRCAVEFEQTAIRDLILDEIEAGEFDLAEANAIYQEELQAERDALVEAMKSDPDHAVTQEADIALVDERLNRRLEINAHADEENFIYTYGELPTWPAGRPQPVDYVHPTPLKPREG